jgi:hypothetical protein
MGKGFAGTFSEQVDFIGFFAHAVVKSQSCHTYILGDSSKGIQWHNVGNSVRIMHPYS